MTSRAPTSGAAAEHRALTRDRFGRSADGYVASVTHAKGAELARLVELAAPEPHWSLLDVATGGGHTARAFAPLVRHVVATDLTPQMLDAARGHLAESGVVNASFELADAEDLPYAPATFHLVTCRIAPHHFPEPGRFVAEAARVARPGGVVLVQDQVVPDDEGASEAVNGFERLRDPSHLRALTQAEWVAHFERAGLEVRHTEVVVKRHQFEPWARLQGNSDSEVERLVRLMREVPPAAVEWLDPLGWGTPEATFVNRHLLIMGRKPEQQTEAAGPKPDQKVVVYVTSGDRLLVFRHRESPEAGIQVPAGTIEPGEPPAEAALREAVEETGLALAGPARALGELVVDMAPFGASGHQRRYFFHLGADGELPDRWHHAEPTPSTGGPPVPFELFWVPLSAVPPLTAEQDAMLPRVASGG